VQRSDRHHVASGENIGCVPTISDHEDFARQTGAVDRSPHFLAEFEITSSLTDHHEARVWPLLQHEPGRLDKHQLAFVGPDHADVCDERRFCTKTHLAPEFHSVARRIKLLQISG